MRDVTSISDYKYQMDVVEATYRDQVQWLKSSLQFLQCTCVHKDRKWVQMPAADGKDDHYECSRCGLHLSGKFQ